MGNLLSISISTDGMFSGCWDCTVGQANYVCKLDENLDALRTALKRLQELRNDVMRTVEIAEGQQMKRLDQVQGWLSRVEALETEVDKLIGDGNQEIEKNFLGGCRPKFSYKLGKKVAQKLKEVADLRSEGYFNVVVERLPVAPVDERPSEPTVGLESTFNKVWSCLGEEQVSTIGLYGLGGVGKTTLLTQINNMFVNTAHDFDFVIWVVVSRDPDLGRVQTDIGKKIGLICDDGWKSKSQDEKAMDIFRILSKKKFVLLLDDIWERFDLSKAGVPLPDSRNNSKLVFTCRSKEVCGLMEVQKTFEVKCLGWEEAWNLFKEKVGQDSLNSHPKIPELAKVVAKECDGLPLALITIGRAMACKKTPKEWDHAIAILKNSASKFSGMGDEVLPLLKFSYDSLHNDTERSCFLYCCLFPEDFAIEKDKLIDYWVGEGFLDELDGINDTQNHGHNILCTLGHACLLEITEDLVRMHGVIRDMALWIANECGEDKGRFLVKAAVGLSEAPVVTKWKSVERISLMENDIRDLMETPVCPKLLTLLLSGNNLVVIVNGFFQFMPALRILDLSHNSNLIELPQEICKLVSLQYLNLSRTGIKQFPIEMKSLVKLKYLNLEATHALKIPQQVISSFSQLQVLKLQISCDDIHQEVEHDVLLVEELDGLKHLNDLGININNFRVLQRFQSSHKLLCSTRTFCLRSLRSVIFLNISFLEMMKHLHTFMIYECYELEDLKVDWTGEGGEIPGPNLHCSNIISHQCFHSLCTVSVYKCFKLKDLTWLIFAPNLCKLSIDGCDAMKEVISGGKWGKAIMEKGNLTPLSRLVQFELIDLPRLKSIYWHALSFAYLKYVKVLGCPNLKKLPLNSTSAEGCAIEIAGLIGWWNKLEWEDEATQGAFLPHFKEIW